MEEREIPQVEVEDPERQTSASGEKGVLGAKAVALQRRQPHEVMTAHYQSSTAYGSLAGAWDSVGGACHRQCVALLLSHLFGGCLPCPAPHCEACALLGPCTA